MLQFGDISINSRLLLGTGKFESFETMRACHEASGTQMVTVAIRRVNLDESNAPSVLDFINTNTIQLLPNTAGCFTAQEAITTAHLARAAMGTSLIKLEVIGDAVTLFPDAIGTLEAATQLVKDGFTVLPYCQDDPILCQQLEDAGCAAVMPLAAPIGSGLGICNPHNLSLIVSRAKVPVIVDAGIGTASDAARAMELGASGVLLNTAIAGAQDPVLMACAFRDAVAAGHAARRAGRMQKRAFAAASSPMSGLLGS